ncbi:hypothetical protein [Pararhizobium sp. IMCC21322]|uniref:hypothetical protein n=1 Tax=Pararhizobium sp. IMCC21322 TaxID=3067903 RepID=UPI0027422341|nr:hypothetical protein [Pararhizobium sp. IMCC21322]
MENFGIEFKVNFSKALLEIENVIRGEKSVLSRIVDTKETVTSGLSLLKSMRKNPIGKGGVAGALLGAIVDTPERYAEIFLLATTGKHYSYRDLSSHQDEYHRLRAEKLGYVRSIVPSDDHPWELVAFIISREIAGFEFEDIRDVGKYIKSLDEATRFQLIEDGVRVDLIIDGTEEDTSQGIEPEKTKLEFLSVDERSLYSRDGPEISARIKATHEALDDVAAQLSEPSRRLFDEIPSDVTFPVDGGGGSTPATVVEGMVDEDNQAIPLPQTPIRRSTPVTSDRQGFRNPVDIDDLIKPASYQKQNSALNRVGESEMIRRIGTADIGEFLPGVGRALEQRSKVVSDQLVEGTNNEQLPEVSPLPRPRPKLNPITEGYLKDMPEDGRLILAAEMVGFNGRKKTDKAEAERLARFDVQRKMAQDLEDIKVGKVSTVWDRYRHPKAVRDLLGEEAYQNFVDDRLEAGIISNATAGLHLLQDAELFGIADGTTALEAPHEKLTELMTPKVLAAAAERARDILDMRRTKPSEAVLLSPDLSNRKAQFDAAFDANEAVDAEEMDAFLFYHEAAQKEIGIAEPAIEMIPPRWASQVAARFEAPQAGNATPTDRRAREAVLKQYYTELQQSFGPRTDDVIAYSLARTASNRVFRPDDGAPAGSRAQ